GWPAGMRASFPSAQGGAVGKPRNPPAHPEVRTPGGRAIGVPLLFGSFLLTPGILPSALPGQLRCSHALLRMRGQAKRKELGRRQAHETALSRAARNCSEPGE